MTEQDPLTLSFPSPGLSSIRPQQRLNSSSAVPLHPSCSLPSASLPGHLTGLHQPASNDSRTTAARPTIAATNRSEEHPAASTTPHFPLLSRPTQPFLLQPTSSSGSFCPQPTDQLSPSINRPQAASQDSLISIDQRTGRAVPHLLRPTAPASASRFFLPQPPNSPSSGSSNHSHDRSSFSSRLSTEPTDRPPAAAADLLPHRSTTSSAPCCQYAEAEERKMNHSS